VVTIAADEPSLFAAVEDLVQELLAGGLVAEGGDSPGRASRAKRAAVQRVQDGRFDWAWELVAEDLESVGGPGVPLASCLADVERPSHAIRR
jgi:hypothetical protein